MQHAILGPGGIGGLLGALLAHSGAAVTLIVRPGSVANYPPQLSVAGPAGVFSGPVAVAQELTQPADVLWIAVKATDLPQALASVLPSAAIGAVVPLLNGIDHIPRLRERFGAGAVVPATIAVEAERIAPGRIVWRSPFARLSLSSTGRTRLAPVVDQLTALGFECRYVDDETTLMWSKLVFLAPFALSTTAAGAPIGQVMAGSTHRGDLRDLVVEACAVARAAGAAVQPDQVLERFQTLPAAMRSSMQKDLERGRRPELDAIAGPILRGGDAAGIPVPATQRLVQAIERLLPSPPPPPPS